MQQLHLVGLTTDHTGLVLSARRGAKTGKYSIAADEKLLTAVQEAQRLLSGGDPEEAAGEDGSAPAELPPAVALPPPPPAKPVSSLSPREIQSRLRAGGTVSEIAAAAGVAEEWILRFADPIRAEQARVVESAQRLTFNKPRLGLSAEPLEASVLLNLAERGVRLPADIFANAWTAFNLHGTSWAVLFSYVSRQRRQTAQWQVDLRSGELVARNRLASDLGYLEPGRRRRRLQPLEVPGEEATASAGAKAPARSAPGSKAPARRASAAAPAKANSARAALTARTAKASKAAEPQKPEKVATAAKATAGAAARGATAARKGPGANKAPPKKAAAAKRLVAAKKAPAVNKAPVPKKAAPAKRLVAVKKSPAAKKAGGRQTSTPGRRPAKKPAAKKPAPQESAPGGIGATLAPAPPVMPDRPTHLARPPSPMNLSNRAVTLPGRLVGAPSLRPHPPAPPTPGRQAPPAQPPPPSSSSRRRSRHDAAEAIGFAPDREPEPSSRRPGGGNRGSSRRSEDGSRGSLEPDDANAGNGAEAGAGGDGGVGPEPLDENRPRVRRRRSERRITPRDSEEPSVVILSTPAVRRLEPSDEPRGRAPAPPS
ncbi:MAG TPA: septation protein SepH [Acidimicrobiales bacterium]|nr:septation protein SepH [Acidimicrobiales bacterium]